MDQQHTHPEGLPFAPEGQGWTTPPVDPPFTDTRVRLLSLPNIMAMRKHNGPVWDSLDSDLTVKMNAVPVNDKGKRLFRRVPRITDDERDRLIALALLVDKGVVREVPMT